MWIECSDQHHGMLVLNISNSPEHKHDFTVLKTHVLFFTRKVCILLYIDICTSVLWYWHHLARSFWNVTRWKLDCSVPYTGCSLVQFSVGVFILPVTLYSVLFCGHLLTYMVPTVILYFWLFSQCGIVLPLHQYFDILLSQP